MATAELLVPGELAMASAESSSASSSASDQRRRRRRSGDAASTRHRHRHGHGHRRRHRPSNESLTAATTDSNRPRVRGDADTALDANDDDVYHRHRKNRQRQRQQEAGRDSGTRRHTASNLTDKSMRSASSRSSSRRSSRCHSRSRSSSMERALRHRRDSDSSSSLASTCNGQSQSPQLNLPTDQEFVPLPHSEEDKDDQEPVRDDVRDEVICMIFDLPESTKFYQDFSCAIASTLMMHGRMYPTSSHVCFYSNVFGRERKILIPYESIREVTKTTTMVFQHAMRLTTFDKDEYTFTSFWGNNRDSCYDLVLKTRDRVLRELRPTTVTSTRYPTLPTSPVSGDSAASARSLQVPVTPEASADEETPALSESELVAEATEDQSDVAAVDEGETEETAPHSVPQRRRSVVSDVDSIAPKDISMTPILEETFPVSVDVFMETFFLDDAPFGLDKFGEQTGSTEMTVNPWMSPLEEDQAFGMTRSLQFRVPVDAPIGPKSSQVDVLQCLKRNEHGVRVVEASTRLVDIPYGDYFSVEERWTIVPHTPNSESCRVSIELKVVFGKSTFWKNTIQTRAISDNKAKWEKWVEMAKQFLESRDRKPAQPSASTATTSARAEQGVESPPASTTSSEKGTTHESERKERASPSKRRMKATHRHRGPSTASTTAGRSRSASVKIFPWILVLLLLFIVVRLQMTLSSIERSLVANTQLVGEMQLQLAGLQSQACSAQG